jgi:hypothetical protein
LVGCIFVIPPLTKNFQVFQNPLHPAQSALFQSSIWSQEFAEYWQHVSQRPIGMNFFTNIPANLASACTHLGRIFLVSLLIFLVTGKAPLTRASARIAGLLLAFYVLLWGFFYGPDIFPRFVSPLYGIGLAMLWRQCQEPEGDPRIAAILLICTLPFSQPEVTAIQISKAVSQNLARFHDSFPKSPTFNNKTLWTLAEHRRVTLPEARFDNAIILSDNHFAFYGPTLILGCSDALTTYHLMSRQIDPATGCAAQLFREMDIRYVWIKDQIEYRDCVKAIRAVVDSMTGLEAIAVPVGQAYFVRKPDELSCRPMS